MKLSDSLNELKKRLGQSIDIMTPRRALAVMLAFYAEQRFDDVEIDEDGDMLLYEWSICRSRQFSLSVTRQFIITDEDEPYQLHLRLYFPLTDALRQLKGGNEWCHSPDELPVFRQSIESSASFRALIDDQPLNVELYFEQC